MRIAPLFLLLLLPIAAVQAQKACATDEIMLLNKTKEQIRLERDQFEQWLQERALMRSGVESVDATTIYKVPVVVHIIHQGEAIGVGTNIPDAQVYAQIEALNRDYRRLNADTVNTPANFAPVAADIGFEFVLAQSDPLGLPTNGITRTNGNRPTWTTSDNITLKNLSYWPSEDYVNIWVAPLSDWLGWAEFPTSTIIPGVNEVAVNNPYTDGVVIETEAFGSVDFYPQGIYNPNYNKGRTLTHEMGHFFGLRHIWGDGDCAVDDYVADTPRTSTSYSGCPAPGASYNSCQTEPSMFMNYMDYVNDDCQNIFTLQQKDRMEIVINNSPRRLSLLSSHGLDPPPPLEVGIAKVTSPGTGACNNVVSPQIMIKNNGENTIQTLNISFYSNSQLIEDKFFNLNLVADDSVLLDFANYTLPDYGSYNLDFTITSVNGTNDYNPANDLLGQNLIYSEVVTTLTEEFPQWPQQWAVRTSAPVSNWNFSKAPNLTIQNTAITLAYFQNATPENDNLILPILDLTGTTSPYLLFDYSYAYRDSMDDKLAVVASTDCGNNYTDTLFYKSGAELSTLSMPTSFSPSGRIDWRNAQIDLSAYKNTNVQLAIIGASTGGNNIYLDNFYLRESDYTDVAVKGLENESGVFLSPLQEFGVIVENKGTTVINQLNYDVLDNGQSLSSGTLNLQLQPTQREVINLPMVFENYESPVTITVTTPDDNLANNSIDANVKVINSLETPPFRENFAENDWSVNNNWTIVSPGDADTWATWNENLRVDAITYGNKGLHDWLVLPPFNFSNNTELGLRYRIAYPENNTNAELLRIWLSTNEGKSFDNLVSEQSGLDMATTYSIVSWEPRDIDWQYHFIDLTEFAGESSVVIAFELTDGDGNNFYLDDVELFVSSDKNIVDIELNKMVAYPNPVTGFDAHIRFSLAQKQDVMVRIVDMQGNIVSEQDFVNVLNQTYPIEIAQNPNGIYLIHAVGPSFNSTFRVLVNR